MVSDRKVLNDYLTELSVHSIGGKVDDVIQMLANYRDKYVADGYFNISIYTEHYYDTVSIELRGDRYETDAEYEQRTSMEKAIIERQKQEKRKREDEERKLYERLKKKYG